MHTILGLFSLAFVVLASMLLFRLLKQVQHGSQRRLLQVMLLLVPLITLGLALNGLHHLLGDICVFDAPFWDYPFGILLPLVIGTCAFAAVSFGIGRLCLMAVLVFRMSKPAEPELQTFVDTLARRLGTKKTRLRLCLRNQPLAFTCGIFRPTIVLSAWTREHLDQHEYEAVVTHEMQHVVRSDYLVMWGATVLRDAFFYLPLSRTSYRSLREEKELICDDLTIKMTQRPLALASALLKIWLAHGKTVSDFSLAQSLVGNDTPIAYRINRLLALSPSQIGGPQENFPPQTHRWRYGALITLLLVSVALNMVLLGCLPLTFLTQMFRLL